MFKFFFKGLELGVVDASFSPLSPDGRKHMMQRLMVDNVGDKIVRNMRLVEVPVDPDQLRAEMIRAQDNASWSA